MLEFATKCPQPASLWKTLSAEPISPTQGYSADQIRFMMFTDLSLSTDFTTAKNRSNNILKNISLLSIVYSALVVQLRSTYNLDLNPTDFQALKPIEDMTDVVFLDNLDIPSIFVRQLLYGKDLSTSMKLIEDLFHINNTPTYIDHIVVDISVLPTYITMYQLNTSEPFQYFDKFTIDSSLPKLSITCKEGIDTHMRDELADAIYSSETGMIPTDTTIVIPEFILQVPAKSPEYSPKDKPSPSAKLSWDDVRVGTKLRCIIKIGDRTIGNIYEITDIEMALDGNHLLSISNDTPNPTLAGTLNRSKPHFTIEEI